MILLDRAAVQKPPDLDGPGSPGLTETEKAVAFYKKKANASKPFKFEAYSREGVKKAVEAVTRRKCAYCESSYAATQPVDVEHFRPKGAVLLSRKPKKLGKPGYYWLAADWSNLLPSCIDCNRERNHEFPQGKKALGKANFFPLEDETKRAKKPGQEGAEKPLLLDPTQDDPEQHLEYLENGAVQPKTPRGSASIEGYALLRPFLAQAREERAKLVRLQIDRVRRLGELVAADPANAALDALLGDEIRVLKSMAAPDQPYTALARRMVTFLVNP